jgi:TolB protein
MAGSYRCPHCYAAFGVALAVTAAVLSALPPPARAAFPGSNGKIVFESDRDGNREIYVMNKDGSGQTNLTNNPARDRDPAWSADGSKIAFVSDREGGDYVYVMRADGANPTRVSEQQTYQKPAWSPDGTKTWSPDSRDSMRRRSC